MPVDLLVVGVLTVREVEPCDVHAGVDEGSHLSLAGGGWAEGADDLGATHVPSLDRRRGQGPAVRRLDHDDRARTQVSGPGRVGVGCAQPDFFPVTAA